MMIKIPMKNGRLSEPMQMDRLGKAKVEAMRLLMSDKEPQLIASGFP